MRLSEINSPGELAVDPDLIDRFTQAGWQIDGEGQDQLVMSKPGSNTVLKVVGSGSLPRQAEIRRYVNFFRANQRNPHFPRVGADRELDWKGRKYYAYTQERLQNLPGDEAVMDYLEYAMGELGHGQEPDLARVPKGLTVEDIEGLTAAVDHMFESGLGGQYGFDLANLANIMQRSNGQLVIVDPFSGFDDELGENFADKKVKGKSRPGRVKRSGASCKGSVTDLRARAKKYGGERGRMYHWCANMKSGKRKVKEVKLLSKVKGKGADLSNLPRSGREIPLGKEAQYLGRKLADLSDYEIWQQYIGGQVSYHLWDPNTRRTIITAFGSRYQGNPHSFIIGGLYAAPGNPIRAAEFYRSLILDLGLTLVSDRKQSPGGQKVWQQLETLPGIEIYGYDTKTGDTINIGASDEEMYSVPSSAISGSQEMQKIARDIRLVATKK